MLRTTAFFALISFTTAQTKRQLRLLICQTTPYVSLPWMRVINPIVDKATMYL